MKINTELIEKSLLELKNDILDICTHDNLNISYFEPKISNIEHLISTLDTISPFIDDKAFINEFTALNIVSEIILNNQFEFLENNSFRNSQINSLYNMGISFNLNDDKTLKLDTIVDKEISINDIKESNLSNKHIKNNQIEIFDKSKEDKKEKIKKESEKLVDKANERLETYFKDPKLMKEYLEYMSKFYNYSERNSLLIDEQFKGAKAVGSFKFWSKQGYKINKGEKGIKILVPVDVTYFKDKNNKEKQLKYATKEENEKIKNKEIKTYNRKYFNVGYVFDISQTNASLEELPQIFPNRWLNGDVANYDKMYHALEVIADKIGVKIIEPKSELGYIKGVSYTETKEVALNPRNGELQNIKTLIHELAHAKLHTFDRRDKYSKQEKEYQAEMIAYATCSYFGLDTSDYSLDYLDNWTKNIDLEDCTNIIKEVKQTTAEYIEIIENELLSDNHISLNKSNNINKVNSRETINSNTDYISSNNNSKSNLDTEYKMYLGNNILNNVYSDIKKLCYNNDLQFFELGYKLSSINAYINKINPKTHMKNNDIINNNYFELSYTLKNIKDNKREFINNNDFRLECLKKLNNSLIKDSPKPKKLSLDNIYVKFISSNSKELNNGDTYDFKTANEIISVLSEKYVSLNTPMNTKFELYINKNSFNRFYSGSIDIGDGLSYDLKNHLFNSYESTRDMLVNVFKPNFENEKDKNIYVKFISSEYDMIKDNSIFKYKDADKLLENLTDICKLDKSHRGYYKTSFELHYNSDCNKPFFSGRFDIGDGYARNLSNHIDKFINEELKNDISEDKKKKLFKTIGINSSYNEKQLDNSLSL